VQAGGPVDPEAADETGGADARREPDPDAARSRAADQDTPELELTPIGRPVAPVVVPRWVQLVLLPIALLALWGLARAAGTVLLVLVVASMVALILAPTVRLLERWIPRGLAIVAVYVGGLAVIVGVGFLLASPVATQITHFEHNVPQITNHANRELASIQSWLDRHGVNVHIKKQGQSALDTLQKDVLKRSGDIVSFSRDLLSGLVTIGFDLVLVLVLSIYLLVYGRDIGSLVRSIMPPGDGTPEDDFPLLVQHAVSGYVRGQLLFSLVMGGSAAIALEILGLLGIFPAGETYAVFFGAFYGLMEFIPYVGPIIGPVPAILVALFQNPISAVWLIILFVALQQLEGHVVAPQVFRISLRINPIVIILALLIGYQLYGIVGALVALPVIAVIRQTVLYLRRHLALEPWGTRGVGLGLLSRGADPEPGAGPERCPDCGAASTGDDAYCRVCGASLEQHRVTTPT
jgi:predicted PurR-regulated permease PerM